MLEIVGEAKKTQTIMCSCSKSFVALSKIPDGTWVSHLQLPRLIYMRWFDLPGMLKYADWMNLVSCNRRSMTRELT